MILVSREESYQIDQGLLQKGTNTQELVEEVGVELAQWFKNQGELGKVLVLCGPGNNGGDGKALGQHIPADIISLGDKPSSIPWQDYSVIVDALFGIGLARDLEGVAKDWVEKANATEAKKIAIDIPSGVDANTGKVWGTAFEADVTLTVSVAKRGLFLLPGKKFAGQVEVIPVRTLDEESKGLDVLGRTNEFSKSWIKKIKPGEDSHKYNRGKLSMVMGEKFPGASLLSAQAARKSGAGYLQIYVPPSLIQECQLRYPGIVFEPYKNQKELFQHLEGDKAQALLLGPGWSESIEDFLPFLQKTDKALIFDGGFLQKDIFEIQSKKMVLTPHGGELDRMLPKQAQALTKWEKAEKVVAAFPGTVVVKGHDSLIMQRERGYRISNDNSPFLATAGSGDVLAGLIASFMAQGVDGFVASSMGVYLHSEIGKQIGWGLTAEDLIDHIPHVLGEWANYG